MLWRFFVAELYLHIYIYSDLDDFFCTSSGGEDFSKSYCIKIFLFEFWFEAKTISELIERKDLFDFTICIYI